MRRIDTRGFLVLVLFLGFLGFLGFLAVLNNASG
jgi:hypothetical protein